MKVNQARVRSGKIFVNLAYGDLSRPANAIVLAYGMPGGGPADPKDQFVIRFVKQGYIVAIPEYIGSFDSYGRSTIGNSVDSILEAIQLLRRGKANELWGMTELRWKTKEITLIGGSFGASVVLVAGAKSKAVKKIVALATRADYRQSGFDSLEENVMDDYYVLKRAYPFTWRFSSKKAWVDFSKGRIDLNAVDYASTLKNKDVLLLHGMKDKVINSGRSKQLYERIRGGRGKTRLVLLKNEGHIGLRILRKPRIFWQVMRFVR